MTEFCTHYWMPDGRRPFCRLCGWMERIHRQLEWSAKHCPDGGSRRDMRLRMGFRQPDKTPKVREHWHRSYADLGFEDRSFGSGAIKSPDKIKPKPFWWRVRMKQILVKSRDTIRVLPEDMSHIVISIRCTDDSKAPIGLTKATKDVLHLEFDDIDHRHWKYKDIKQKHRYFNDKMAKQAAQFVERYKNEVDIVFCQCAAGISRSSGMAAAFSKFYFGKDDQFFTSGRYVPNMLVYRLMLKELMGGYSGMTRPPKPPKSDITPTFI